MADFELVLYDMGLRLYHPPVILDPKKYLRLVEDFWEIYPTQRKETDAFEFSLSPAQSAKITPSTTAINDLFDDDVRGVTRRVFHVLGRILEVLQAERIETFDHMVSARLKPASDPARGAYEDYPADLFVERSFLKNVDFKILRADDSRPLSSVSWAYDIGDKGVGLRIEPFQDDRDLVFIELSVQHPAANISLGDIRAAVEEDLRYLHEDVVKFLRQAAQEKAP